MPASKGVSGFLPKQITMGVRPFGNCVLAVVAWAYGVRANEFLCGHVARANALFAKNWSGSHPGRERYSEGKRPALCTSIVKRATGFF